MKTTQAGRTKNIILFIAALLVVAAVSSFYYYFWVIGYRGDFEAITSDLGVETKNISCRQMLVERKVVCTFEATVSDLEKISAALNLERLNVTEDQNVFINKEGKTKILVPNRYGACASGNEVKTLLVGDWENPKQGAHATTYTGIVIVQSSGSSRACAVLDIAYG